MNFVSFDEAIRKAHRPSILLGSGFSGAFDKKYLYDSLFSVAVGLTDADKKLFKLLDTVDFEKVILAYKHADLVLESLGQNPAYGSKTSEIRQSLIRTINLVHDSASSCIYPRQYQACINFLKNFEFIFSLNYDLLLYWVMQKANVGVPKELQMRDGFGYMLGGPSGLVSGANTANVYFLHGALHIYEDEEGTKKSVGGTFKYLTDVISNTFDKGHFPVIVTEGTPPDKLARIQSNSYLRNSLEKFSSNFNVDGSSFFSFGVSFNEADQHLLKALAESACEKFYIGVYSKDPTERSLLKTRIRSGIIEPRIARGAPEPEVNYVDVSSLNPWS